MNPPLPAVFDCNVFLQAMLSSRGAAHACWQKAVAGEIELFITDFIVSEIRKLPEHRSLRRFRQMTPERVDRFIEEILDIATLVGPPREVFTYARDLDDAHYVNLAIATNALLVVSNDKDLLELPSESNREGQALLTTYPRFRVLTPAALLGELGDPAAEDE